MLTTQQHLSVCLWPVRSVKQTFPSIRRKFMKRSVLAAVSAFALLCGLWTPKATAQAVYGSILGTITDPSGAAVANAKVTATSQTKNTSVDAVTNDSGNYSVTHLIPDIYSVRVEGQGFKNLQFKDVLVSADTGVRVDGQFQVGGSSETVRSEERRVGKECRSRWS